MSKQAAAQAVGFIAAAYPRQEFPEPSQRLYIEMLSDLDDRLLLTAVKDIITKNTFLPSISEVRSAAAGLIELASGRLDAYSAWDCVHREIIRVGSYGQPDLDDLTLRAVRSIGGWRAVCLSENGVADRSRFISAYETFLSRERADNVTHPSVRQLVSGLSAKLLNGGRE